MFKKFFEKPVENEKPENTSKSKFRPVDVENRHDKQMHEFLEMGTNLMGQFYEMLHARDAEGNPKPEAEERKVVDPETGEVIGSEIIRLSDGKQIYYCDQRAIREYYIERDKMDKMPKGIN